MARALQMPIVQEVVWHNGELRDADGVAMACVPEVSASFARTFMEASNQKRQNVPHVDILAVLEQANAPWSTIVAYGTPDKWPDMLAERVAAGKLRLGVLRICRRSTVARLGAPPRRASKPDRSAPDRLRLSRLRVGVKSDPGGCAHMEDTALVHTAASAEFAFCCVYDGHGGSRAAHHCREHLHFHVMHTSAFGRGDMPAALIEGFHRTEESLAVELRADADRADRADRADSGAGRSCCGATALVALLRPDSLHVANLGDCRAVLSRRGAAVPLTRDHTAAAPDEAARVVAGGGEVLHGRLGGFLQVTRALGNLVFEATAPAADAGAPPVGRKPLGLSATPELHSLPLCADDEFVVLASDGLWDVVGSEDAVRLARAELLAYGDATMAAEKLVEEALKRHGDDNITAVVVCLHPLPAPPAGPPASPRPRLALKRPSRTRGAQ